MDRIDLRVEVRSISASELMRPADGESSALIAQRVARAREIQAERYEALGTSCVTNAHANNSIIEKAAASDVAAQKLLGDAAKALKFLARGFQRILKVARTLADLDSASAGAGAVGRIHLAQAISYRIAGERLAQSA